jgi:DNA-binding CsgD family transcriptional regulator
VPAYAGRLLEREAELAELRAALQDARRGVGGLLLLEGAAGIGKSALLRAAEQLAERQGLRVLRARGGELEREFPYGLVRQLFEPTLAEAEPEDVEAALSGAAAVRPLLLTGQSVPTPPVGAAHFELLHGLYWLTSNLAERSSLLLTVDDAHWGDEGSLRFFDYIARRLEGLPILMALAARPAEPGADARTVGQLAAEHHARVLRPAALSEAAVAELVRSALGQEAATEFCEACHKATAGNPFALRDLLVELQAEGVAPTAAEASAIGKLTPRTLSRAVLARLARVGVSAQELARAVAVLGDGAELRDAGALAGLERAEATEASDVLVEIDILAPGRPLSFVHPLIRSAIYHEILAGERSAAHESAARLLAAREADPDEIAVHLLATDPAGEGECVELLRDAARRAVDRGAADAAVKYLARAWDEPPPGPVRPALLRELLTATFRGGDVEATERFIGPFIAVLANEPDALLDSAEELAYVLYGAGRAEDASSVLARAVECAHARSDYGGALRLDLQRLQADRTPPREIKARLEYYRGAIRAATPAERLWRAAEAWHKVASGDSAAEAANLARRALRGWTFMAEAPQFLPAELIVALLEAEDFDFATQAIDVVDNVARAAGSTPILMVAMGYRADLELRRGQVADALVDASTAIELGRQHGFLPAWPYPVQWIADALVERGELDAAQRELQLAGLDADIPDDVLYTPILASRARLSAARGIHQRALDDLMEVGRREERDGREIIPWRSDAAVLLAGLGKRAHARRLAEVGLERARRWGAAGRIGRALRSLALVDGGDESVLRLQEAVEILAPSQCTLEYMRSLTDLGATLRRLNRRAAAREPLRKALELARTGGALAIAMRAHEELAATGEKLRPLAASGVDSLTPSERRIASMAASGTKNRDIAQALFLTVKTVETHLTNVYWKLGIRSRKELPNALARHERPETGRAAARW